MASKDATVAKDVNYGVSALDFLTSLFHIRKMKTYFHFLDADHDSYLTLADFDLIAARSIANEPKGISPDEIRAVWHTIFKAIFAKNEAADEHTKVSYEELIINSALSFSEHREMAEKNMRVCLSILFDCVDIDMDGIISFEEYKKFHHVCFGRDLGKGTEIAFLSMDRDKDGNLTRQQFIDSIIDYQFETVGEESDVALPFGPLLNL